MKLTLKADGPDLAVFDLGEPHATGYFDEGDLCSTSGNLYIELDGVEYGSLFIMIEDGRPTITLGQFDYATEDWEERNPLVNPVVEP